MKIRLVYNNLWRKGTIYNKSDQHPQYPWDDTLLDTPSQFGHSRYGAGTGNGTFVITDENKYIDFDETGVELTGTVALGTYNGLTFAAAIAAAMNAAPGKALTYACVYNETTAKFTISAGSVFNILWNSGSHWQYSIAEPAGYATAQNDVGLSAYTSDARRIHWPAVYFDMDLLALSDINFLGIINHNLTTSCIISLILSTTPDFSSGNTTETLTFHANSIFKFISLVNKRYVRVKIEDPANPNPYIQIGPIWVAKYFEPSRTFSGEGYEDGGEDPSDVEFSPAGVLYAQPRPFIDGINIVFNRLDETSKSEARALIEEVGLTRSLLAVFDYSAPNTNTMLARLEEIAYLTYLGNNRWTWNCGLREIF